MEALVQQAILGMATLSMDRSARHATISCLICANDVSARDCPQLHPMRQPHRAAICTGCIRKHAKEEVAGKYRSRVLCPAPGCTIELTPDELRTASVNQAVVEQLDKNQLDAFLLTLPDFRWCSAPGCGSGQEHIDGVFMRCQKCHSDTCPQHRIPFHYGMTCDEYDESMARTDDGLSRAWIQANTKACPQCLAPIKKEEGCDHMTCRVAGCGFEFCWLCLVDYSRIRSGGNAAHNPTCLHYRSEQLG